ncbi:MAG: YlbF family regulator [Enterococcus lacertideformus]|uniref:YlbF family regulator n=1 Tax=Enterococcus lacertideformus TaxID=2771493 RepID=A0A931FAA2_9ENTE|nr:YlbF family regulator [Enterococcus lacertideformus]
MQKEPNIQREAKKLAQLLSKHETIVRYKELEQKVQNNHHLNQLTEAIKVAQKEAVNCAHYGKKVAEKEANSRVEQLIEANDLLHHLTGMLQDEINEWIEEEDNASKN